MTPEQFGSMERAPQQVPLWFWYRHSIITLRRMIDGCLRRAGTARETRVLEYGCGNRPYQAIVGAYGAQYTGADLTGNTHAHLHFGPDGVVPAADGSFDTILSVQVLEHVPDPVAHLNEVRRLLSPGGKMILSTHGFWIYHPCPEDLWRWTAEGLRKVVEANGFRIVSFQGVMGVIPGALQLIQDTVRRRLPQWLRKPFCFAMQAMVQLTDRMYSDAGRAREAAIYVVLAEPVGR